MSTRVKDLKRGASVQEGRLNDLRERTLTEAVPGRPPTPMVEVSPRPDFVETPFIRSITERALTYVEGGFPVHFRGPTGCGKTTLAIHLATQIGRPMMLLVGDEELVTSELVGGEHGYSRRRVIDNFIHSVMKTEDRLDYRWVDSQLTVACQQGYTLVYDEFSRSRPEANNVLLPVLEERILILPTIKSAKGYLRVHPEFTAIFTSNPTEYAGVHLSQEALLDRMITIDITHFDRETELAITQARTGVSAEEAKKIVDLVRGFREATNSDSTPTVRSCIMIGKILAHQNANGGNLTFGQIAMDIFALELNPHGKPDKERRDLLLGLIKKTG
ncbi:MAG: gas vesicle protein GvpN [Anaerolineae bacterium]